MEIPWNCPGCGAENWIDMERLDEWPLDRLVSALGYTCGKCGMREAISFTAPSLQEAEPNLTMYKPTHRRFAWLFAKLVRKQIGVNARGEALARASVRTWLALDRFAQIIGLNPLNFNQLSSRTLFPNNVCGDIFFQHDYQHSDRLGRETIAMAIQQAEMEIAREAGFNLMPDWAVAERLVYPHPAGGMPFSFLLSGGSAPVTGRP